MIGIVYYLFNFFGKSSKSDRLILPKWVKLSEERFHKILSTVTKAENQGLKANEHGREITLNNAESSLKDLCEFKNRYNKIANDVEAIVNKSLLTGSQNKMLEALLLLKEILKLKKSDEESDTTDMPELESEESAAEGRNQPGQGLKILTPDQMLSILPITLARLKAGNNSKKLINEIGQLLYSLYR